MVGRFLSGVKYLWKSVTHLVIWDGMAAGFPFRGYLYCMLSDCGRGDGKGMGEGEGSKGI